jgi:hypothetical protein
MYGLHHDILYRRESYRLFSAAQLNFESIVMHELELSL